MDASPAGTCCGRDRGNHGDSFAKHYDLGRLDDELVLLLLKGIDWWILGADDAEEMLRAVAGTRSREAAKPVTEGPESADQPGTRGSRKGKSPSRTGQDKRARASGLTISGRLDWSRG